MRDGWREGLLLDFAEVIMGQAPPGSSYNKSGNGIPFIQGSAEFGPNYPAPKLWCDAPKKVARPGDVLLSVRAPVGDTNIANAEIAIGRGVAIVRGKIGAASSTFLRLVLEHGTDALLARSGTGMFTSITGKDLRELPIVVPSLREQERIVDLIATLDTTIHHAETEAEAIKALLRNRRDQLFANPIESARADDVFDIRMGLQRSPERARGEHQTSYLRSANVLPGRLDLSDVKTMSFTPGQQETYALLPGDVLVSEGSASADAVGAPAMIRDELKGTVCFQNTLLRYRSREGKSTPFFTYHWCQWAFESGAFRETASGTNIKHIGSKGASSMRVPVLPRAEQEQVAAELEAYESALHASHFVLSRLRALRANLLTALLSGEHEVPESYDELMGVAS